MKKPKNLLIALVIVLIIIQFMRPVKNNGNAAGPDDIAHAVAVPAQIQNILEKSCYDCHSNHTEYPWYFNFQPVAGWLAHHVDEGKDEINFSEYNIYKTRRKIKKLKEIKEQILEGEMPMDSYLWIHGDAKLSEEQKTALYKWVEESLVIVSDTLKRK